MHQMSNRKARVCERKTDKKNVYDSFGAAKIVADIRSAQIKRTVEPYQCDVCHRWHNGKTERVNIWKEHLKRVGAA